MYPSVLAEQRVHTHTPSIDAEAASVFALLCPMRETEWIPGWSARMIHSRSGVAELGAIFATPHPGGETLWVVTAYEPPRRIQFVRHAPDGVIVLIDIAVDAGALRHLFVHVRYAICTVTALARAFGLSRSTLLYYDRFGLVRPSARGANGYRWYSDSDARRLERVVALRATACRSMT